MLWGGAGEVTMDHTEDGERERKSHGHQDETMQAPHTTPSDLL